ncbi:MAG: prepilin-type N-terminal cleavage/methylation domain-containing protein [Planctomycetes bacterium]|nr:prepilin-type N-terminal cleavage/methylation domain-containing protein [Planctomycetota bacterium]
MSRGNHGWTLVELLVVVGILALLVSLLLPALSAAKELAGIVKVQAELKGISTALEMYALDNSSSFPPERTWCSIGMAEHSCQLPRELAQGDYLPSAGARQERYVDMNDVFNPGFTYKYKSPGIGMHNEAADFKGMWIPDAFPGDSPDGDPLTLPRRKYDNNTTPVGDDGQIIRSPIAYALWSVGPGYDAAKPAPTMAPVARSSWYRGRGDNGVIPLLALTNGELVTYAR